MERTTLGTVAKKAGVSKTTASLVLNGKAASVNIAQTTIERVKTTADQLNYKPGHFNPGRLNGKTGIIAVIASHFLSCRNSLWLHHIIVQLKTKGYVVVPVLSGDDIITSIENTIADGYIIPDKEAVNSLTGKNIPDIPLICAGFKPTNEGIESICPDYRHSVNSMISLLYRHNKKAIGLIAEDSRSFSTQKVIETYRDNYCDRFDIPENLFLLSATDNHSSAIAEAIKEVTAKGANGIIFETPEMAIEALSQKNVRDLAAQNLMFACCGERPEFKMLDNDILLVCPENIEEMTAKVVEKLLNIVSANNSEMSPV
ncbi:MAG: LacI family transcriptional regulator [Anaerophaga sp.]|nr:LacI family transcriptional regulator [Anaerophaga sp.]